MRFGKKYLLIKKYLTYFNDSAVVVNSEGEGLAWIDQY
jgi:hypothetical protein